MLFLLVASENITNCFDYVDIMAISQSYSVSVYVYPNYAPSEKCLSAYDGPTTFQLVFDNSFSVTSQNFDFSFKTVDQRVPYTARLTQAEFYQLQTYQTAACNFVFLGDKVAPFYVQKFYIVVENNTDCWSDFSVGYDNSGITVNVIPLYCDIPVQDVVLTLYYGPAASEKSIYTVLRSYTHTSMTALVFSAADIGTAYDAFVAYFREHRADGARVSLAFQSDPADPDASLEQEISAEVTHIRVLGSDQCNTAMQAKIYYNARFLSVRAEFSQFDLCYSHPVERPDLTIEMIFQGTSYVQTIPHNAIKGTFGVSFEGDFSVSKGNSVNAYLEVAVTRYLSEITSERVVLAEYSAHGEAVRGCVVGLYATSDDSSITVTIMSARDDVCNIPVTKQEVALRVSIISDGQAYIALHFRKENVQMHYDDLYFHLVFTCKDSILYADCRQAFKDVRKAIHRGDERNVVLLDGENEYCIYRFLNAQPSVQFWIYFAVVSVILLAAIAITIGLSIKMTRL